jgi:hypothetical protein
MLRVICIDDITDILGFGDGRKELTYGKEYKVIHPWFKDGEIVKYELINDLGQKTDYRIERFVSKSEFREIKLRKLGIW